MMAAIAAAENGNKVTLIEQNEKLGKKLFLTGKGRCNITNACPVEELFDNIVTNPKFLYSAFYGFDNGAVVDFFNNAGLKTKIERGERVFPQSDHSSDVIKALKKQLESYGVAIMLNTKVLDFAVTRESCGVNKISSVIIQKGDRKKVRNTYGQAGACYGRSFISVNRIRRQNARQACQSRDRSQKMRTITCSVCLQRQANYGYAGTVPKKC